MEQAPLGKGRGSTGSLYPTHGAPSCWRCLEQRQGVASCCKYGHEGHPRVGAPRGRGLYVSRLGMRMVLLTNVVAAARGMHGWLRRPRPEDNDYEESDAGASEQPLCKAAKVAQRGGVEREREKGESLEDSWGRPPPRNRSGRTRGWVSTRTPTKG